MTEEIKAKTPKQMMTPLWVISLFVSLTEVVTGIAVIKATGGVQVALTTFVIAFPILVAFAFFFILWYRPYVFYPPAEFSDGVDVDQYVNAMKPKVDNIRADLQAEIANLRASLDLSARTYRQRIEEIEGLLANLTMEKKATQEAFIEYKKTVSERIIEEEIVRSAFEHKSKYRIHLVSVTKSIPSAVERHVMEGLADNLRSLGYRTSVDGLASNYYLVGYKKWDHCKKIMVISLAEKIDIAHDLAIAISSETTVPVEIISYDEAIKNSNIKKINKLMPEDVDVTIAYLMS